MMNSFRKYLLMALILALLNAVLVLVFFFPEYDHTDTPQYISAIKNISGDESAEISPYRMLKPLPILIGAFLTNFTVAENTLIIQNLLFYFLFVVLIYILVYKLYQNEKQAFYGAVLGMTAYPMLAYGLASLTDLSGWFFFLLSALLSLNFLKSPRFKTAAISGAVAGFGMLFKESVAAAPFFFVSLVFVATYLPFKEKIKYILAFGLGFLIFPAINSIVLYNLFSYSYWDVFRSVGVGGKGAGGFYMYTFPRILIEIGRVFLAGWIFILLGIKREFALGQVDEAKAPSPSSLAAGELDSRRTFVLLHPSLRSGKERIMILLSFIPSSLSVFLWCSPHNRMLFIGFPILVLLGSFGLLRNFKSQKVNLFTESGLLFLYIAVNYVILELLLNYGIYFWRFGDLSY